MPLPPLPPSLASSTVGSKAGGRVGRQAGGQAGRRVGRQAGRQTVAGTHLMEVSTPLLKPKAQRRRLGRGRGLRLCQLLKL